VHCGVLYTRIREDEKLLLEALRAAGHDVTKIDVRELSFHLEDPEVVRVVVRPVEEGVLAAHALLDEADGLEHPSRRLVFGVGVRGHLVDAEFRERVVDHQFDRLAGVPLAVPVRVDPDAEFRDAGLAVDGIEFDDTDAVAVGRDEHLNRVGALVHLLVVPTLAGERRRERLPHEGPDLGMVDALGDELQVLLLDRVKRDVVPRDERRVWHATPHDGEAVQYTDAERGGGVVQYTDAERTRQHRSQGPRYPHARRRSPSPSIQRSPMSSR
jgi:hypothetical protein